MSAEHQPRFMYQNLAELEAELEHLNLSLPMKGSWTALAQPVNIGRGTAPNRLAVHPMEGCDGTADGRPSELTYRRYRRFAAGGAGLIWMEATAVTPEGRANPRQLQINEANLPVFRAWLNDIDDIAPQKPYKVLQLTHSGRYARPEGTPKPQVAVENPWLDKTGQKMEIMSDEQLAALVPLYRRAAEMAYAAGFDAVDIKACHRYLISELLSAHTRPGPYGGSLENRTRLLLDIIHAVREAAPIDVAVRLNAFDEIPYPYGWGVDANDFHKPDWREPVELVRLLAAAGVTLIDVTGGNPYYNPHVNRPYDAGPYTPPDHPLIHAVKLIGAARTMKTAVPEMRIIATGLTWFRQFAGPLAAGLVEQNWCDLAGFGRLAFAYPDFAADLLAGGGLKSSRCCITCGKCSQIMRDGGTTGCVVRDAAVYLDLYRAGRAGKPPVDGSKVAEHV
ncbi:MAG: NADH:flavin oxidoreductase [Clostridiaceae bacterium]|nr:NADH:flavin oxidoreductase [Clostridiaceae bacterium]